MTANSTALLFPGQGILNRAKLADPEFRRYVADTFADMESGTEDAVSAAVAAASRSLQSGSVPSDPTLLQLSLYGMAVAEFRLLHKRLNPAVLVGHSFGEIAALTAGGALNIGNGAEIVWHRATVLEHYADTGGMIVVEASPAVAESLLHLVGREQISVAAENSYTETVFSGTKAGMASLQRVIAALELQSRVLKTPYPLHHKPVMIGAAAELTARIENLPAEHCGIEVFSPVLDRYYEQGENLSESVAQHLIAPVRFTTALQRLMARGVSRTIECGGLSSRLEIGLRGVEGNLTRIAAGAHHAPAGGWGVHTRLASAAC